MWKPWNLQGNLQEEKSERSSSPAFESDEDSTVQNTEPTGKLQKEDKYKSHRKSIVDIGIRSGLY